MEVQQTTKSAIKRYMAARMGRGSSRAPFPTLAGPRVFIDRYGPLQGEELPAIILFGTDETGENIDNTQERRHFKVGIEIQASGDDAVAQIDFISDTVINIFRNDEYLGGPKLGLVEWCRYTRGQLYYDEKRHQNGIAWAMDYDVRYIFQNTPDPCVGHIAPFELMATDYGLVLPELPGAGEAALYDAFGSGVIDIGDGVASQSFPHACAADAALVVFVSGQGEFGIYPGDPVVSYAGVPLTLSTAGVEISDGFFGMQYSLLEAPEGLNEVEITFPTAPAFASFVSVSATGVGSIGFSGVARGRSSTAALTLGGIEFNSLVVDGYAGGPPPNSTLAALSGEVVLPSGTQFYAAASTSETGAMGYGLFNIGHWLMAAMELRARQPAVDELIDLILIPQV